VNLLIGYDERLLRLHCQQLKFSGSSISARVIGYSGDFWTISQILKTDTALHTRLGEIKLRCDKRSGDSIMKSSHTVPNWKNG
jgi:hypothetical protein